ncbi:uncharacterized protein LOC128885206 [Hylaeus volcanicus]|uniref:uncharacterized protein LOC128885206 n=1 Tax=Hylaeus volcanicus TaxID=313075 RepID=UPI0023B81F40|nr:uncharacterized protein LOC128885206 [Hylaeus volcanicus]XP_053995087.1 uncharacterized protein LOC128885206 [Hylaeus volcanicus]
MKIWQTIVTIYTFVFAPSIALVLLCSYLYRRLVDVLLWIQFKDKYVGLMDGTDRIWAVEDPPALSVNNILLILEKDARHSNANFLESFRNLAKNRILASPFEKLLYKRRNKFGYHFWERSDDIDLTERVRWLEYERTSCDGSCDSIYSGHLKRVLWNVCNQPLPEGHTASWEILIGKCCPRSSHHYLRRLEERLTCRIRIPVLFRVHHSLGDGMALLKFFREVIVDGEPIRETYLQLEYTSFRTNNEGTEEIATTVPEIGNRRLQWYFQKDLMSASMPFTHFVVFCDVVKYLRGQFGHGLKYLLSVTAEDLKREMIALAKKEGGRLKAFILVDVWKTVKRWLKMAKILVGVPACLVQQAFRSMDKSALHGAGLSGEKLVSYWLEDDFKNASDQKLFTKIQNIKSITGARFGDVFLAALSASLHKYFLNMNEPTPNKLSVILPTKLEEWSENFPLQNNFSVGILPLCVSQINGKPSTDPRENSQILERLEDVKSANDALRTSPDYLANFLVMKYISAVLPERFLRPMLESQCTMVFSNLVGPQEAKILGHSLKNIVFWIPNRSYTGIGCSLLTYRGYLHMSLVADKALVQNDTALTEILENTVSEIDNLYDKLTLSFFSKKLRRSIQHP